MKRIILTIGILVGSTAALSAGSIFGPGSKNYSWPPTCGSDGQVLMSNGSCTLTWSGSPEIVQSKTATQIAAITPTYAGEQIFCSNCVLPTVCLSTGTTTGSWIRATSPNTDWTVYTPTGTWTTNTSYNGTWRRVGGEMQVRAHAYCSGAPTSASLNVELPTGYAIDTVQLSTSTLIANPVGTAIANDNLNAYNWLSVNVKTATAVGPLYINSNSFGAVASVTQAGPFTFGNGDGVSLLFSVPIVGWSATACQ